jgi:hypothetical protein
MRIRASTIASLLEADLKDAGWDGARNPYPGQEVRQYVMMSQTNALLKKYLEDASRGDEACNVAALALFEKSNEHCRTFVPKTASMPSWIREALGEAKDRLHNFFFPPTDQSRAKWDGQDFILTQTEMSKGWGVGPGASIGAVETDFYTKLASSTLDASDSALHKLYVQGIRHNPTWLGMEISRAEAFGYGITTSSKLSFVPKTSVISRTICTEPLLNMIFQKGIASVLERRLRQVFGIDLSLQPDKNRELALIGSVTGEFGTIDLSSASDSMSLATVREFFPKEVVTLLERCRTGATVLPDGSMLELHMISSMGNAFTFPLQTIFFAALVYGAYSVLGIKPDYPRGHSLGNFAVFGDDIIVVTKAYDLVCEMLAATGFSVNVDKSFNEGLFRESCGRDFYFGRNVRGVYFKKLQDANDCYSAINRLNRWSAEHQVRLPRTVQFLASRVRFLPIPFDEDDAHGIKVPYKMLPERKTYCENTGGVLYRISKLIDRKVTLQRVSKKGKLTTYLDKPSPIPTWINNPDGFVMAFLAGSIRDGSIVLRTFARCAKIRRKWTSRWDYFPVARTERFGFCEDWKAFTEENLSFRQASLS